MFSRRFAAGRKKYTKHEQLNLKNNNTAATEIKMLAARTTTKLEASPQDDLTSESVCEVRRFPKVPLN